MSISVIIIVVYLVLLIGIGLVASRRTKSVEEFYVAGKRLGYWVSAFSARATGESGWLLLGLTGMGWAVGVHAFWVVLGEVVGVTLSWIFLARPFKRRTDAYGSITIADYLESRFNDTRHILRIISSVVIVTMVVAYLAAQLTASGKAFRDFLGLDFGIGVIIGLVVVLIYTVWGGFLAVAWSDLFQGVLMLVGLVVVPTVAIVKIGGLGAFVEQLSAIDTSFLEPFGEFGFTTVGVLAALSFMGTGLGFLGSPQVYTRMIAVKDEQSLIPGSVVAVFYTVITDSAAVVAGMAGRVLYTELSDPEAIFPILANELFPEIISGFLIAVVLAAIMSTADSLLILAVSAVVRDVYQKIFRPDAPEVRVVLLSRILVISMAVLALFFALMEVRLVFWFVLFAWAGIASAFCPVIILSLFWEGLTLKGAAASMISGFVTAVVWKLMWGDVLYEMIPAFSIAFIAAVVVSWFDR